ncbi:MAG: CotH kinase family protein, partial [Bacteroidota bacterium]
YPLRHLAGCCGIPVGMPWPLGAGTVSLLGLPTEEDWILHGPYTDKTLMRNVLIMQMARETGQYASRTRHVELLLNGEYRGVYVLMEKIKRDGDRVDIAKLDSSDIAGDDLTGGYIFQINNNSADGWNSNYDVVTSPGDKLQFSYVYPKHSVILPVQEQYIQAYVDSFEQALIAPSYMNTAGKRYDEYIDLESFAEHFILSEVGKNVDAYRLSSYVWKKKDSKGGKLHAGPMWDFNLAFFNADYCDAWESFGWMYDEHCDDYNPFWWGRLRADPVFMNVVYCRWNDMRATVLDTANLYGIIDSVVTHLGDAADRNFEQWPVLGTYLWPNPATPATYAGEIQNLKDWLADRLAWLDANITGSCMVSVDDGVAVEHVELTVWPNPGREAVRLDVSSGWAGRAQLRVVDLRGQIVLQEEIGVEAGRMSLPLEVEALAPGVYAIVLEGGFGRKTVKWVKI